MGYQLRRVLADALPADLSPSERLVVLELADHADEETGLASGPLLLDVVARRAGLANTKQVGRALSVLAGRGLEVRVLVTVDSAGRPVFAHRGRPTTYDIGALAERLTPAAPQMLRPLVNGRPPRPAIPSHVRRLVFERDEHCCVFCGASEDLSLDHILPKSRGGSDDGSTCGSSAGRATRGRGTGSDYRPCSAPVANPNE